MLKSFVGWFGGRGRKIYLRYGVLALVVMLPLLAPGFILTLDMVFTPKITMPDGVTSSYLFNAMLHYLNILLPSEIIQKTMLFFILVLSGIGAHRLVQGAKPESQKSSRHLPPSTSQLPIPAYFAGILYMINPFTYSRFMTGQYNVLLGYALMPFFVRYMLKFLHKPSMPAALRVTGLALAISIVSIHSIGLMLVMVLVACALAFWRYRGQKQHIMALAKYGAAGTALAVVASSYWLVPTILGTSKTAESIQNFSEVHRQAFATEGAGQFGAIGNVMSLQGFWADAQSLYMLPKDASNWWLAPLVVILGLVIVGALAGWRKQRFITVFFTATMLIAVILSVGVTPGLFTSLNRWLIDTIPFFAGYREPQKFVGLIALAYAILGSFGIEAILRKVENLKSRDKSQKSSGLPSAIYHLLPAIILILPLLYMPTMLWGFNGQLKPRHYPNDWYTINQQLNSEAGDFKVLFLPWHQYMKFGFAERVIANPADKFFDREVISSDNPEFGGIGSAVLDPSKQQIEKDILVRIQKGNHSSEQLAGLGIKYIVLSKEKDYMEYGNISMQEGLQLVNETATIKLYRNTVYKD